jgi:hypothetical protein
MALDSFFFRFSTLPAEPDDHIVLEHLPVDGD